MDIETTMKVQHVVRKTKMKMHRSVSAFSPSLGFLSVLNQTGPAVHPLPPLLNSLQKSSLTAQPRPSTGAALQRVLSLSFLYSLHALRGFCGTRAAGRQVLSSVCGTGGRCLVGPV